MWGMHDGMGWWMLFGGIWMVVFWAAVIWLIAWGVSQVTGGSRRGEDDPFEIARRRDGLHPETRRQPAQHNRNNNY